MQSRRAKLSGLAPLRVIGLLAASFVPKGHAQATPAAPDLSPLTAAALHLDASAPPVGVSTSAHGVYPSEEDPLLEVEVPGLERRADGGYRFRGIGITATIGPDGQVRIRDKFLSFERRMKPLPSPGKDALPEASGARVPVTPPWLSLQFNLDVLGYMERKLGADVHASEKRWFMERTLLLRERLQQRAVHETTRRALLSIWSDARLNFAERKRATFELWNQSAPDEQGANSRRVVEEFIRERCPAESACGFSPKELKLLNRANRHAQAFAPYASDDAQPFMPAARHRTEPRRL